MNNIFQSLNLDDNGYQVTKYKDNAAIQNDDGVRSMHGHYSESDEDDLDKSHAQEKSAGGKKSKKARAAADATTKNKQKK